MLHKYVNLFGEEIKRKKKMDTEIENMVIENNILYKS